METTFTPRGVLMTDGMVYPERPWILSVGRRRGLYLADPAPEGIQRYAYGPEDRDMLEADFKAAQRQSQANPEWRWYGFTDEFVQSFADDKPHSWVSLRRLPAMRARFSAALANDDLEAMGRCFAWGAANGFTPEQIANGQDYPAAEISDAEEAETETLSEPPPVERVDTSDVLRAGSGPETVYAYGFAGYPDRLKIGYAKNSAVDRIAFQIRTGMPDTPRLLLEISTKDCRALESVLHGIFKLRGRKIEGIGDEWYRVTRDMVIEVYNALGINE